PAVRADERGFAGPPDAPHDVFVADPAAPADGVGGATAVTAPAAAEGRGTETLEGPRLDGPGSDWPGGGGTGAALMPAPFSTRAAGSADFFATPDPYGRSAFASSAMCAKRWSLSFSRHFAIVRSRPSGASGNTSRRRGGVSWRMAPKISATV